MPAIPSPPPADGTGDVETAAAAVTAAQRALHTARHDLAAAIHAARHAGQPVHRIAAHAGLDPVAVRNILAVPTAKSAGQNF
ncbi:hypothetical protein ACIHFC_29575 [Streptomyces sp. NPDC052013]|uniref:hypothetical protein n=1 Tax=Streptomyces sp. NPDC052013 TaxID=3365679 RepID=UPI0037D4D8C9